MAITKRNAPAVLPEFQMEHLGTSFQVILVNSVRRIKVKGEEIISIPDQQGLYKLIAHKRAIDPRKLTGGDVRFLRRTLDMKAKDLAALLDISPEYLSRCESGEKIMASNAEKMLRLNVLLEPFYMIEKATEGAVPSIEYSFERLLSQMAEVRRVVRDMKIIPATDVDDEIVYQFRRKRRPAAPAGRELAPANDDDGCEWLKVA